MPSGNARRLRNLTKEKVNLLIQKEPENLRKHLLLHLMLNKLIWKVCLEHFTKIRNITEYNYIKDNF